MLCYIPARPTGAILSGRQVCTIYLKPMQIRIFTLSFDELSEGFPDEIVTEFCLNKKVHRLDTQFFLQDGRAFWTVAIHYEIVLKGEDKLRELDESQRLLFTKLKKWRKEQAGKEGIPPYLVATNAQFLYMVKLKCRPLDCFRSSGFRVRSPDFGVSSVERKGLIFQPRATPLVTDR